MAGAAGPRNLIVHRYGDLAMTQVARILDEELAGLEAFVRAARVHAER
jgi:uncharacterized protein YutE (UPF0331/DUF86 family)